MSYQSPYQCFYIESYQYDPQLARATFHYSFDKNLAFTEELYFEAPGSDYNLQALDRALQLAHVLLGISYYKVFPTKQVEVESFDLASEQAEFFSTVYRDGLSQFVYENNLQPDDIAVFNGAGGGEVAVGYAGQGLVALQSGGKDSLLLAELLRRRGVEFASLYVSSSDLHPSVIDEVGASQHRDVRRRIDSSGLGQASQTGGLNGHVPITYLVIGIALIDMVLNNDSHLLLGIGQEGEEPYLTIGDYAVRHQWSKTYQAELMMARYVSSFISPDIRVGSPLRGFTELRIAELFAENCWTRYGRKFASCNVANYKQGQANSSLSWCGNCAKCANSFLLFAPFVNPAELRDVFGGNLFENANLTDVFKGLLAIDGATKPFECIGETDELRLAYHMALDRYPEAGYRLPFEIPVSNFDYGALCPLQAWAQDLLSQ